MKMEVYRSMKLNEINIKNKIIKIIIVINIR